MSNTWHVAMWPNGDWCWRREIESYGRDKSDDYQQVSLPEFADEDDVNNLSVLMLRDGHLSNETLAKYFGL